MSNLEVAHEDRIQQLREALDKPTPEAWIWKEDGDEVIGTVTGGFTGKTKFGPRKVLILRLENGTERAIWLSMAALESQVLRLNPVVGDLIGIRHLGKRQSSQSSNEYDDFVARKWGAPGGALGWDAPVAALEGGEVMAEVVDVEEPDVNQDPGGW